MKAPEQDQLVQEYDSLNAYLNNYLASNSWGHYDKDNKWGSDLVFTGKAVREWILNKMIGEIEPQIENGWSLTAPEHFLSKTDNIIYSIKNVKGIEIGRFEASARIYAEAPVYEYYLTSDLDNLKTLIDTKEFEYSKLYSSSTSLRLLSNWNDWKEQSNQYIVFPINSENVSDYFTLKDFTGSSITDIFTKITDADNDDKFSGMFIVKNTGLRPLDDSDENATITFKNLKV